MGEVAKNTTLTNHKKLIEWVDEMGKLCGPDRVVWCDGSEAEKKRFEGEAVQTGEIIELNQKKLPGCYLSRSATNDVARVEIHCISDMSDDLDADIANTMIGAVRDAWAQPSIDSDLEIAGGLKIFGTTNEGESFRSDEGNVRQRMLAVTVTGSSIIDVP